MKHDFIDLFAGIGGIRLGFEQAGFNCVFGSEIDPYCRLTYEAFFGKSPENTDITELTKNTANIQQSVPNHNILTGGFPCQPFSLAGVSKKASMNKPHGFDDETSGTLFFDIKQIIRTKEPDVIFLENVKNLRSHNNHKTYDLIYKTLENPKQGLKYIVSEKVIDASKWVPQHRERIFIIGVKKGFKENVNKELIDSIFPIEPSSRRIAFNEILVDSPDKKYTLTDGTWLALQNHRKRHYKKGNGFGYGKIEPPFEGKITRTLSARYYKDGAEILIVHDGKKNPRRLTPLECLRLMGFPKGLERYYNGKVEQPVSNHQSYKQFGNSVVVPLIYDIARNMKNVLF